MTQKNLTNLGLNPGQMVRTVPDWVDFCVDYDFLSVSRFMMMNNVELGESHLHYHK